MKTWGLAVIPILLACQEEPKPLDGVYTMCKEVQGYSGETIELRAGKFRYWFYSDVVTPDRPQYPLTGTYRIDGKTLVLDHVKIHSKERTIATVNGTDVLWRDDGLRLWEKEKRLHPYAVLLRVSGATDGSRVKSRPSIESLKTKELKDRDKAEYDERFNEVPDKARTLLRARSLKGDSNLDAYKKAIAKARVQPSPELVAQLVGLLHHDSPASIESRMILEDLFLETWLVKEAPAFSKDQASKQKALEAMIAALSSARDRNALEHTIMLFLQVSGVSKIDLPIEGAGVRISLEYRADGAKSYDSRGPDDIDWLEVISQVIPECQKWMRVQLSE